jgi:hypothetical protein
MIEFQNISDEYRNEINKIDAASQTEKRNHFINKCFEESQSNYYFKITGFDEGVFSPRGIRILFYSEDTVTIEANTSIFDYMLQDSNEISNEEFLQKYNEAILVLQNNLKENV